jgi:hypothetical protein
VPGSAGAGRGARTAARVCASEREQNRFRSGTSGFPITAERGSGRGTSGTCTRPAPSRLRPEAPDDAPEERTDTERAVEVPDRDRESRPETERREVDERDDARDDARELLRAEMLLPPLPTAIPVGGELTIPSPSSRLRSNWGDPIGETTGVGPQVSQYSSPPPMSS